MKSSATRSATSSGPCCSPLTGATLSEDDAAELASLLKALADPVRLRLVSIIAAAEGGEICACDLPAMVDRTQPTVSHHLSILVDAGIATREQRGKWAWFALESGQTEKPSRLELLSQFLSAQP